MTFIGYIEAETDRAILFWDHFWQLCDWLPKKQITVLHEDDTHEVKILASPWICQQKGIREFEERTQGETY